MSADDLAGGDVERGKERARSMPLVFMGKAGQGATIGHFEPALRPLQRLNAGLFIKTQHHRVFRRRLVESDDVRRFLGKLRVGRDAPTSSPFEADSELAQDAPNPICAHRQGLGQESAIPARMPKWRRDIELLQQSRPKLLLLQQGWSTGSIIVVETIEPLPLETHPPLANRRLANSQLQGNLSGTDSFRRPQNDAGALGIARLGLRSAQHGG